MDVVKPVFSDKHQQGDGGSNGRSGNLNNLRSSKQQQQRVVNKQNRNQNKNLGGNQNQQKRDGTRGNHRNIDDDKDQVFKRRRSGPGEEFFINKKLRMLQGPLTDISPIETEENKFFGRNRLFIGNLTNDATEDELIELFRPFGDISEIFMNKDKNYAFVRVDYFSNAVKAKRELEGTLHKNRMLRLRFAPSATIIRVRNLTPWVSDELLFKSFEVFGSVERAFVHVDERGKSTGKGIVEFKNKPAALVALRYCTDKCYFLTASLRPVIVEPYTYKDDSVPEKSMNKKHPDFYKARQKGPRFAEYSSFEHEYGQRWKQLYELYRQKAEALKREMIMEEEKLEAQIEFARYEHETEQLREELRKRERNRDRQKADLKTKIRIASEDKRRKDMQMKPDVQTGHCTDYDLQRIRKKSNVFMPVCN
ncbi:hrp65 protein-like isoform X2 [Armigeres subalbatus]|uniref:hrp65 protein-like isoform X2 n=1 Tax=Armigeres subalbatus TaxID=124917 RepID=UPI002ED0099F|nr:mf isoform 1 [Armigeres subalbatus]